MNGVGPKVALAIVSGSPAEELRRAIVREDAARFQAIPGIGKKTAERIVLELKEKLAAPVDRARRRRGDVDEHVVARDALVELGYSLADAERALAETDADRDARGACAAGPAEGSMSSFVAPVLEDEDDEERRADAAPAPRSTSSSGRSASRSSSRSRSSRRRRAARRSTTCCSRGRRASARRASRYIIREELGVGLRTIAGPAVEKKDIAAILTSLEPRDVLFVDEIHRMSRTAEEILYPALEDFRIDIVMGEGAAARTLTLDLPPFTLVGATTRTGLLTTPLRDRFGLTFRLDYYDAGELGAIVHRSARILGVEIAADAAEEIARRSRGTPRIANRILRRVRDVAQVRHQGSITNDDRARGARRCSRSTSRGSTARRASCCARSPSKFDGGPVGLSTLAASLGEEQETIEDVYEPYLLQLGFIQRTPRGRTITKLGRAHIGAAPAERARSSSERHLDADVRGPARGLRRAASTARSPPSPRSTACRRPPSRSSSPTARASCSSGSSPSRASGW